MRCFCCTSESVALLSVFMLACSLDLQVEEEPESRGGRRRTWDDEHVLKRQFSALVPAFDPRPGRTNIAQTQDIVIPAPGKVSYCNYNYHYTLAILSISAKASTKDGLHSAFYILHPSFYVLVGV